MDIILYMWEDYEKDEFSAKIITLLKLIPLEFKIHPFEKDTEMDVVSKTIGEKVRKLPQIAVDGERIGGYYDLVEHLINKEVITYTGEPKWNTKTHDENIHLFDEIIFSRGLSKLFPPMAMGG